MDPIKDGAKIFNKIHELTGKDLITDTNELETFMNLLIEEIKGWVIVNFLDTGNWDRIDTFEIDHKNGRLFINWHDYRNK